MKLPLPLKIPRGHRPIITQQYGSKENLDWYKERGINVNQHNGTDIVISGGRQITYGTRIVCPVDEAHISRVWWDNPMSTKGNGIEIAFEHEGDDYRMKAWHCSEVVERQKYKRKDTIGYIGNSGAVKPEPSIACIYCGSHIHLMLYKNDELIDPLEVFDPNRWFASGDTDFIKDMPPIRWLIDKFREIWL